MKNSKLEIYKTNLIDFLNIDTDKIDHLDLTDAKSLISYQDFLNTLIEQPELSLTAIMSLISEHELPNVYWGKISAILSKIAITNPKLLVTKLEQIERIMFHRNLVPLKSKLSLARLFNIYHDKHLDSFVADTFINSNKKTRVDIGIIFYKCKLNLPLKTQDILRSIPGGNLLITGATH